VKVAPSAKALRALRRAGRLKVKVTLHALDQAFTSSTRTKALS